ncbi:MAG: hypothetical protein Q8Q49_06270, partial [bacterium]|nr:hypothetical protein [bacterium]
EQCNALPQGTSPEGLYVPVGPPTLHFPLYARTLLAHVTSPTIPAHRQSYIHPKTGTKITVSEATPEFYKSDAPFVPGTGQYMGIAKFLREVQGNPHNTKVGNVYVHQRDSFRAMFQNVFEEDGSLTPEEMLRTMLFVREAAKKAGDNNVLEGLSVLTDSLVEAQIRVKSIQRQYRLRFTLDLKALAEAIKKASFDKIPKDEVKTQLEIGKSDVLFLPYEGRIATYPGAEKFDDVPDEWFFRLLKPVFVDLIKDIPESNYPFDVREKLDLVKLAS